MPGSRDTLPAPDLPDGRRLALVVATATYQDTSLRQLRSPARDAAALGELLKDPAIGGFDVTPVLDRPAQEIRLAVEDFLSAREPEDLLVVYLSCHGLVDARRRLYFAASDTMKMRLAATGVEAQWLLDQLDDCRARRQVLILDCCFSGAFADRAKGDADLALGERFQGQGRGRVVLTASRASEYSFEGEPLPGAEASGSVFTSALVQGIRTGAADRDNDGFVSVDEAYAYAFDAVRGADAHQTPQRWLYGVEGDILLARSPAGIAVSPAPLPDAVRTALDSPLPTVRLGGVAALGEWLVDADLRRVLAARRRLQEIADSDVPRVADAARAQLTEHPPAAAAPPPVPRAVPAVRAGAAPAKSAGPAQGETTPPPASGSATPPAEPRDTTSRWAGRHRGLLVAAAVLVVGVVAGSVAALVLHQSGSAGRGSGATSTTITQATPWRLAVRDDVSGQDNGCTITVSLAATGEQRTFDHVFGTKQFQIPRSGTFRVDASDAACLVAARPGSGSLALPFAQQAGQGDTDAFTVQAAVGVQVVDFAGGSSCELVLRAADDGRTLDFGTASSAQPAVQLHSTGSVQAYLADLSCGVRVSGG